MVIDFLEKKLQSIERNGLDQLSRGISGIYPSGNMLLTKLDYNLLREKNQRSVRQHLHLERHPDDPGRSADFDNVLFIDLGQEDYLDRFFRMEDS